MAHLDTSLRDLMGYRLRRANSATTAKMTPVFARFGLRQTTFSTLAIVVNTPGLRQAQIAEALAIERPNFVKIMQELELAGLLERHAAVDDGRAYALHATPKGRALFHKAALAVREQDERLVQGLTSDQVSALFHALDTVDKNTKSLETLDDQ